jgi:hypothetical protein
VTRTSQQTSFTEYERDLRSCIRDLVALSTMPTWWIGRTSEAIAEITHDLLLSMLRTDTASVQVWDPTTEKLQPDRPGDDANRSQHLASFPIGLGGELGRLPRDLPGPSSPTRSSHFCCR